MTFIIFLFILYARRRLDVLNDHQWRAGGGFNILCSENNFVVFGWNDSKLHTSIPCDESEWSLHEP